MPRQSNKSNNQTNEDEVGYKHPPLNSQFRKGQSGNPRGRRKGQRNVAPVVMEILSQQVTVKQGGKARRVSKGNAVILMLMSKAQNGDGRAGCRLKCGWNSCGAFSGNMKVSFQAARSIG